jgi:magnesium transporter
MKQLTAWAAIILVPTLVAGIYGMNFRHMPELDWVYGYPLAIGTMLAAAYLLYRSFHKREWL